MRDPETIGPSLSNTTKAEMNALVTCSILYIVGWLFLKIYIYFQCLLISFRDNFLGYIQLRLTIDYLRNMALDSLKEGPEVCMFLESTCKSFSYIVIILLSGVSFCLNLRFPPDSNNSS